MKFSTRGVSRRTFLQGAAAMAAFSVSSRAQSRPPNIILITADDLGYGDLSCYGSGIRTPHLDQMASEGVRFNHFLSASAVCSPSRAALLTGRYPNRVGVPRVLDPNDAGGLPASETTISQMLRSAGYRTMCIGKWHLGSKPGFLPTDRGFDEYFGIPYSNDMSPCHLMHNTEVIERPAKMNNLTQRYTHWATQFISQSRNSPFFLYLPQTFPHIPLAASEQFAGLSGHGDYGDAVQELDWSVGQIAQALRETGLDANTMVMFTSDNGPWFQGSAGGLRGRKGDTYEGGHRVPLIARFPGRIPESRICERMSTALDILPTIANMTGAPLPAKRIDGVDLWPLLAGQESEPDRDVFLYFNDIYLQCARLGPWKLHLARYNVPMFTPAPEGRRNLPLPRPELYHVVEDPGESYDRAERNPGVVADLQGRVERLIETFPADIVRAYNETMQRQVEHTPVNALPVEKVG